MTGTDELLTEILKSRNSSRSSSRTSSSAASTSAPAGSLVANCRRWSGSDPELAPIRIGVRVSFALRTTCSTFSAPPMLPGLIRTAATPASIARSASDALKWMSAITGRGDPATMAGNASASARPGTATRTTSHPASASRPIWPSVASTSCVSVSVIDCTTTGAPPPMGTPPTLICLSLAMRPKRIALSPSAGLRAEQVVVQADQEHQQNEGDADRRHPLERRPRDGAAPQPLDPHHQQVPAVQRQEGQQVEDTQRQRQVRQQPQVWLCPRLRIRARALDDAHGTRDRLRALLLDALHRGGDHRPHLVQRHPGRLQHAVLLRGRHRGDEPDHVAASLFPRGDVLQRD